MKSLVFTGEGGSGHSYLFEEKSPSIKVTVNEFGAVRLKLFVESKEIGVLDFDKELPSVLMEDDEINLNIDEETTIYKIDNLSINKNFRRKGLGSFLLKGALKIIASENIEACVILHSSSLEPYNVTQEDLFSFYEKFCFKKIKKETFFSCTMAIECIGDCEKNFKED